MLAFVLASLVKTRLNARDIRTRSVKRFLLGPSTYTRGGRGQRGKSSRQRLASSTLLTSMKQTFQHFQHKCSRPWHSHSVHLLHVQVADPRDHRVQWTLQLWRTSQAQQGLLSNSLTHIFQLYHASPDLQPLTSARDEKRTRSNQLRAVWRILEKSKFVLRFNTESVCPGSLIRQRSIIHQGTRLLFNYKKNLKKPEWKIGN